MNKAVSHIAEIEANWTKEASLRRIQNNIRAHFTYVHPPQMARRPVDIALIFPHDSPLPPYFAR